MAPDPPRPVAPPPAVPATLAHALHVMQESLAAFQRMQEQTAQRQRQFLETQESAQRTLQTLVDGQQRLLAAALGMPAAPPHADACGLADAGRTSPMPPIAPPAEPIRSATPVQNDPPSV